MKKLFAVLLVAGAVLAGCSSISSGYITKKDHREGYYYTTTYCASYDSKGICTMWMPRQNYVPPTWKFDIQDTGQDGKTVTGWVNVNEDTYSKYNVGDYYND